MPKLRSGSFFAILTNSFDDKFWDSCLNEGTVPQRTCVFPPRVPGDACIYRSTGFSFTGVSTVHHWLFVSPAWRSRQSSSSPYCSAQRKWRRWFFPICQHVRPLSQATRIFIGRSDAGKAASSHERKGIPLELDRHQENDLLTSPAVFSNNELSKAFCI